MKLSSFSQGRNNNFNLIRIVAALAVLITHSYDLVGSADPVGQSLGMTMGSIAVDVFFITSGFLVTASLLTRQSIIEFIWARVLRIYPALLVLVVFTVFVLGVYFTTLPLSAYFTSSRTYTYLLKCSTLISSGVPFKLPGVFENNPYKSAVNGSIWTMPYEVRMYVILAAVWFVLRITRSYKLKAFQLIVIIYAVLSGLYVLAIPFYFPTINYLVKFSFMFFTGASFYVLKEHIHLSPLLFWLIVIALAFAIGNVHLFYVTYTVSIAYLLFFMAYVPSGHIRKYNRLGDYSYGLYIWAFPVQQSVAALIPGVSVTYMIFISAAVSILLAVISWHILERRALSLKDHYVGHTRRWFGFTRAH
jgi:peptidoglycan/LPS O-acetylase OafA/YrhL